MIPKTIHYCWLSTDPMPAELKECIKSWKKKLPDYKIKLWNTHNFDVESVPFVSEAVKAKKWAFACDYIRIFALYTEGGVYFDSDVYVKQNIDFCLKNRAFSAMECYEDKIKTISEKNLIDENGKKNTEDYIDGIQIQAAILGAEKGHPFFKDCLDYYQTHRFKNIDGSLNTDAISPFILSELAVKYGFKFKNEQQSLLEGFKLYPIEIFAPNMDMITDETVAVHCCAGSWRWMETSSKGRAKQYIKEIIKNFLYYINLRGRKKKKLLCK